MSAVPYFVIYALMGACALGVWAGGLWPLITPALVFGLIPLLDLAMGHDPSNPDDDQLEARRRNPLYDLSLRLWVPLQLVAIGAGLWRVAAGVSLLEGAVLAMALGTLTGAGGINIAHELVHRTRRLDRALAEILMGSVTYSWFCVEHVLGHHRRVATEADPATSRLGESFYRFLPRVLIGSAASAWALEAARCGRRGIGSLSLQDRRLRYLLTLGGIYLGLGLWGGWAAVGFFAAQSAVAIGLLEAINYVEHYGLRREISEAGRVERVAPHHSWNSTHRLTGWFLFNLPRHADHHAWASRPYWMLRSWEGAPQLPLGYASMVVLALVPPLWFRLMDPRVEAIRGRLVPQP